MVISAPTDRTLLCWWAGLQLVSQLSGWSCNQLIVYLRFWRVIVWNGHSVLQFSTSNLAAWYDVNILWYAHLRSIETDLTMIQNKTQSGIEAQTFGPAGTMSQYVRVIFWYVLVLFDLLSLCINCVDWCFLNRKISNTYWGHRPFLEV